MRRAFLLLTALFIPSLIHAAVLQVPGQFPTIQDAIDAAADGDTVLVAPGTYVENIDFKGKAVVVTSEKGPDLTVIDGGSGVYPYQNVVTFENGEGPDSVLEGFTITNGKGKYVFYSNQRGGGIYCQGSSPTIRNNVVYKNSVSVIHGGWASGGGIYCDGAALVENNVVHGNGAGGYASGGGIYCLGSCIIRNNTVYDNYGAYGGGGILCGGSCIVQNNAVFENTAVEGGGGIECYASSQVENNRVYDNAGGSFQPGGGIYSSGSATLRNNVVFGNTNCGISTHGACILANNTVCQNADTGVFCAYSATPEVHNTILWDNGGTEIELEGPSAKPIVSHCDVEGGWPGEGNIDAAPLFADPSGGDFHLAGPSPCINRGANSLAPPEDMDGDPRPFMGTVEIGADEFTGTHPLEADVFALPEKSGGQVHFALHGGIANQGRAYLLLASAAGTAPGTPLPGSQAVLPLNWDLFTNLVVGLLNTPVCQNFAGALGSGGAAYALFDTLGPLPPGTAGMTLSFAFALNKPWDFASNPIDVVVTP